MNSPQQNVDRASERAIEIIRIETYPQLMKITDVINWDDLKKITIGTNTIHTNGELIFEPSMDWDIEDRVRIISLTYQPKIFMLFSFFY